MSTRALEHHQIKQEVERHWRKDLTLSQHAVLMFVTDRTHQWGKEWETITLRHFLEGVVTRAGKVVCQGLNMSKSTVIRCLRILVERGYILKREAMRCSSIVNQYALNLEKLGMALPKPKKERKRDGSASLPKRRRDTSEIQGSEQFHDDNGGVVTEKPHKNKNKTINKVSSVRERDARAPSAREKFSKLVQEATDRTKFALRRKAQRSLSPSSIEAAWKASFMENHETGKVVAFTKKDHGCAKTLYRQWGNDTAEILEWCVANWHLVGRSKFRSSKMDYTPILLRCDNFGLT